MQLESRRSSRTSSICRQPQNIITETVEQAIRIERDLNNEALEQPLRRTRWGPEEPESLSIETLT
ncbi:uncharacterized protein K441DRAFT_671161 [Cenococcum geophilum 1.58]|uniref:Uncharacterized protein n=1 Tax=Cenococcum geophilum 1.58 TaxID=794803 RepID=A0ACC8ENN4_9PEZI|nr:hypothetical protein K441DRAFT_671161 [Cenococcum geophilum 1.58]